MARGRTRRGGWRGEIEQSSYWQCQRNIYWWWPHVSVLWEAVGIWSVPKKGCSSSPLSDSLSLSRSAFWSLVSRKKWRRWKVSRKRTRTARVTFSSGPDKWKFMTHVSWKVAKNRGRLHVYWRLKDINLFWKTIWPLLLILFQEISKSGKNISVEERSAEFIYLPFLCRCRKQISEH